VPTKAPVAVSSFGGCLHGVTHIVCCRGWKRPLEGSPGQPEIGDDDPPVMSDQDVVGLEVTMDQPGVMGGGKPPARLYECVPDLLPAALGAVIEPLPQRHALHQLHRQEDLPRGLADLVDRDDVRMGQFGHGLGLTYQTLPCVHRPGHLGVGPKQLQRHPPIQFRVVSGIHDAHRALAEHLDDEVPPELRSAPQLRSLHDVTAGHAERRDNLTALRAGVQVAVKLRERIVAQLTMDEVHNYAIVRAWVTNQGHVHLFSH